MSEGWEQVYPEAMQRDPTGRLAAAIDEARKSSLHLEPMVTIRHGRDCRSVVAQLGRTPNGIFYTLNRDAVLRLPDGSVPVKPVPFNDTLNVIGNPRHPARAHAGDDVAVVLEPIAGGVRHREVVGTLDNSEKRVIRADGEMGLLVEPPGLPPPPETLDLFCRRCRNGHTIARTSLVALLRDPPKSGVHFCEW